MKPVVYQQFDPCVVMPVIMVVEDEVLIRLFVADALIEAGFDVIEACSADEALILLSTGILPDLIFSDVNMPGTADGLDLAAHIKQVHPHLPVILTSGGVPEDRLRAAEPVATVMKPYTGAVLLDVIEQVLGGRIAGRC